MKKYFYFLLTGMILFLLGCENGSEPETGEMGVYEIHLQQGFKSDIVSVELDGKQIFKQEITTDYLMPLAEVLNRAVKKSKHLLKVKVNNEISGTFNTPPADSIYVTVNYNQTDKLVTFSYYDHPLSYR